MPDVRTETRVAALQIPVELLRGLDVLDREIRGGKFAAARESVRMLRDLVHVQERAIRKLLSEATR
ncbi:hypothetical protein SAMN05421776_105375 [Nocardia farcinica]|uniref:Uncharacterized protein n=1 Tax=Nocardia farcinica TaxID=37329 RepID=A0A0H5NE90_NOCFR|nr:hypothetical protein [Nocardia farcinica]AXK88843.1 hypothetical protein DXT66_27325 [Nocardia farcinica]MBA4858052.1 hypothetical protein [Nocardia farcinica]MBC9819417.1 hypothetical protein [Nocardia farcinica]PFX04036.1 hypothetical protein CJ469_01910 [Nocardia farcinica]PFX10194.1 hypothetical protein CJ468_01041 [Nocardia farcinica]